MSTRHKDPCQTSSCPPSTCSAHPEGATHAQSSPCCSGPVNCCDTQNDLNAHASQFPDGLLLHIPAMDCPTEEGQIRAALKDLASIRSLRFDLVARTLDVDVPASLFDEIIRRVTALGMPCRRLESSRSVEQNRHARRKELFRAIAALGIAVIAEMVHLMANDSAILTVAGMAVAALAIGLAGFGVLRKGWASLTQARLNINALMTVAVVGAFLIGDWPEAAMVMALYSIAELIEARAVARARHAIKGLLDLAPTMAQVRQPDGRWQRVDVKSVQPEAVVRVGPGERFAFDGMVVQGHSSADQSAITGESIPVEKSVNDPVFAGTVNQYGELIFKVSKPASDTVLARIIHVVEQAQVARAPIQRFVDRFAAVYTPAVFVIAVLVALLGPLVLGLAWIDSVYKALVLLVIACPCALVISTPVTIVSGLTAAARMGILIKGGAYLERAHRVKQIALDKTGTLTHGRPQLVASQVFIQNPDQTPDQQSILALASMLAARSDHPVSVAIASGLKAQGITPDTDLDGSLSRFTAQPGYGVTAEIDETVHSKLASAAGAMQMPARATTRIYRLGKHRWMQDLGLCTSATERVLEEYEAQGYTLSLLADEKLVLAVFAVADTLRETAPQAVEQLRMLGVEVVMLTGDNGLTARKIASMAGIEKVRADLLPQDKLDAIRALQTAGGPVGMVGDGINDSPALASADIGFAMGEAGTDIAMETADVVIMNDDLGRVARMIELSRKVNRVLWQNITLALGIKGIFLLLAIFDHATMWMAVFADMGASLLVVLNGLRLVRTGAQKHRRHASASGDAAVGAVQSRETAG